jgi:hypothetical protein
VLVAYFSKLYVNVGMPNSAVGRSRPLEISLDKAWLVGNLSIQGGQMSVDNGSLAGRWLTAELFRSMRQMEVGTEGEMYNCKESLDAFEFFRALACGARDLGDGGEPKPPCNAISVAIGFTARPANPDTFTKKPIALIDRADENVCPEHTCDEE